MPRRANESSGLGVHKSEIIWACQFSDMRKLMEFAIAEILD